MYDFTIDDAGIRKLVPFELSDKDCEGIAHWLDSRFDGWVAKVAADYRLAGNMSKHPKDYPIVYGTITPQADGMYGDLHDLSDIDFDCTDALNRIPLSELPPNGDFGEGACDYGDEVIEWAWDLGLVERWDGPYYFRIYYEDEYLNYLDYRIKQEYGYEPVDRTEDPNYMEVK